MEHQVLEQFLSEDSNKIRDQFLINTSKYITENKQEMVEQFMKELDTFFKEAARIQQETGIISGSVQISFLRSSVYFEKPQVSFEAYDKYGVLGKKILEKYVSIPWLFRYWEDYKKEMAVCTGERHLERYVSPERVRVLMNESITILVYFLVGILKYPLSNCDDLTYYKGIVKEKEFSVSIGEYFDWQKTVFMEVPQVDIFFNTEKRSLQYQKYTQIVYKNKQFKHLDLSHTRFTDCHFVGCTFQDVVLNDCDFIGCRFQNIVVEECTLYGTAFEKCLIQKSDFNETQWWGNEFTAEPAADIYREGVFQACVLNTVGFTNSSLKHLKLFNNDMKDISLQNCELEDSDMQVGGDNV
jgi:hypothetical protein